MKFRILGFKHEKPKLPLIPLITRFNPPLSSSTMVKAHHTRSKEVNEAIENFQEELRERVMVAFKSSLP